MLYNKKKRVGGRVVRPRSAKPKHVSSNLSLPSRKKKTKLKKNMQFIESTHKYVEDGRQYTPVTYFVKFFQPWVDWDQKCRDKAAKLGITFEELRAQWDKTRDDAANKGTAYHKMKEMEYLNGKGIVIDNTLCPVVSSEVKGDIKEDSSMLLQDNTVYTENGME